MNYQSRDGAFHYLKIKEKEDTKLRTYKLLSLILRSVTNYSIDILVPYFMVESTTLLLILLIAGMVASFFNKNCSYS